MPITRKVKHKTQDGSIIEADIGALAENVTQDSNHRFVTDAEKAAWNGAYEQATGYTDQQIADLINGAPSTLDTLKEIADAMAEHEEVVDALEAAIGTKAPQAELDTHTGNSTIHLTATERQNWDNKQSTTGDTKDNVVTFTSGDASNPTAWTDVALIASGEKHSSLFNKISTMFKNVRYLYKLLGTGSIPEALGANVIAALNKLNTNLTPVEVSITNGTITYIPQYGLVLFRFRTLGLHELEIGQIPEAYRPESLQYMTGSAFSENAVTIYAADISVDTDGTVTVRTNGVGRVRGCGFWFI